MNQFKNEAFTDFSKKKNQIAFEKALQKIRAEFGKEYPIIIGGVEHKTNEKLKSKNPSNDNVLGVFQQADAKLAQKAIETAAQIFENWKTTSPKFRADFLFKAAKLLRKRKHEFSATMVYEVGKSWAEADGDTAEAIDFLEFYGREMLRYSGKQPITKIDGEKNEMIYIPIGVGAIIPPWNFPLAILVGMTTAAIVCGNTVVLKPSSDAPLIAWKFFNLMQEIKLPVGVINFLTGPGGTMGDLLVENPKIRFVSFTGSKEVGIHINELAAKVQPGQIWLKRVVAEMGGKDGILIDKDSNLIDAASATISSAFGFQGQKCSAASRAIVVEEVYDEFVNLLKDKVSKLTVGQPDNKNNFMGPVINNRSMEKILQYINTSIKEGGKLLYGGKQIGKTGSFIEPTIIIDVKPTDTIAVEEIFGPVLAVIKVKNFDEGLKVANGTEFGLTGGVWTLDRKKIERAKKEFHVGNFYINRKITGAFVGVHPFGGFNMSGTDSKAGGRDYLLLFMQAKTISEKI